MQASLYGRVGSFCRIQFSFCGEAEEGLFLQKTGFFVQNAWIFLRNVGLLALSVKCRALFVGDACGHTKTQKKHKQTHTHAHARAHLPQNNEETHIRVQRYGGPFAGVFSSCACISARTLASKHVHTYLNTMRKGTCVCHGHSESGILGTSVEASGSLASVSEI